MRITKFLILERMYRRAIHCQILLPKLMEECKIFAGKMVQQKAGKSSYPKNRYAQNLKGLTETKKFLFVLCLRNKFHTTRVYYYHLYYNGIPERVTFITSRKSRSLFFFPGNLFLTLRGKMSFAKLFFYSRTGDF